MSYKGPDAPYREWMSFAETLYVSAALAVFAGFVATVVASAILLDGKRRAFAIASLICLAAFLLGAFTAKPWDGNTHFVPFVFAPFLTLVSIVYWPTRSRWVNWPLLAGGGVAVALVLFSVVVRPPFHTDGLSYLGDQPSYPIETY